MAPPPGTFHSKFGGLWIDQTDRDAVARGFGAIADPELRQRVIDFERDGFVIIRRAAPSSSSAPNSPPLRRRSRRG